MSLNNFLFSRKMRATLKLKSDDVLFEERISHLTDAQQFLFCLDNSMIKLRGVRKELNKIINNPATSKDKKSQLRKQLKKINSKIRKNLWKQRDFTASELDLLVREFKIWLNEYLLLQFDNLTDGTIDFFKAAKRGNSIYRGIIKEKLNQRTEFFDDPNFDKLMLREKKAEPGFRAGLKSNVLFLTLSWNPNIFLGSRKKAWLSIEYFYNKFITRFRKKYGKTWVLKGVESTKAGYPHIHILAICEKSFETFKHRSQPTKENPEYTITYRVKEKRKISKFWNSFVDILVPSNVQAVRDYVLKDIIKQYDRGEHKSQQDFLSLALCWLFNKQSYSISCSSADLISERIIQTMVERILNSNPEKQLIYRGLVVVDFSFPYLKRQGNKPPPNSFRVKLSQDKCDSLSQHRICEPRDKNLLQQQLREEKKKIMIEKYHMNKWLEKTSKKNKDNQHTKRIWRFDSIREKQPIKLDLLDRLHLLAFGVA